MAEYIQGYRDIYGEIHATKEAAEAKDREYQIYQDMYKLFQFTVPLISYPQPNEIAEYVVRNYEQIKMIMERYGR